MTLGGTAAQTPNFTSHALSHGIPLFPCQVELDGRESSTFERMAIRGQQRRNARTPRFPEPLQPSLPLISSVHRAAFEKSNGQKVSDPR